MKWLRILALCLLLFNSAGALYGGWLLMTDPTGAKLKLPEQYIQGTLFDDYLIPGIILFIVNGLFGIATIFYTLFRIKHYPILVIAQGLILTSWIIIQMLMIQVIYFLQFVLGGVGIALVVIGLIMHWLNKQNISSLN